MSHRCSICNRTDNFHATVMAEDFYKGPYTTDPHNELLDMCYECWEEINDTLDEMEEADDGEETDNG